MGLGFKIQRLNINTALEIEGDGAGEGDVGEGGASGVEVDLEVAAASDDLAVARDDSRSCDTGAAGPGFVLDTALVCADEETAVRKVLNKVDIGALGEEILVVADAAPLPYYVEMADILDTLNVMR